MLFNYFLILITLLLVSGLAIDAGMLEWRQLHLQNAADAAAMEGMYQRARSDSAWITEAQAESAVNGFTNGANNVSVALANPPASGSYSGDSYAVQATVSQSVSTIFMGLVNGGKSTIAAKATAREIPTCVWIMNPTNSNTGGGSLWLASADLVANCGIYINTSSGQSLTSDGFSGLGSLRTRIVGSASSNTSSGYVSPKPRYGSAVKIDPLNYVTAPTLVSCNYSSVSISGGSYTASPGTYCGGFTLSNTTINLSAGLYIIAGGLTLSNSTLNGTTGVTLYFTKNGGSSYSNVSISNSTVYLKAPTTTAYGGIVGVAVFADRNWITHGSQGVQIQYSSVKSDGVWYLPNTGLYLWQNTFSYYTYLVWMIDNLYQYATNATFSIDYTDLGGVSPLHYEDGVLVE